ncbi:hypothetical protein ABPG75_008696 [Micractinium tetrahymenae]
MAASRAPHPLAEAICELAAPPLRPTVLRMMARHGDYLTATLLLRIRPRPLAAGLEVAVHSGVSDTEEGEQAVLSLAGVLYGLASTDEGIQTFARDILRCQGKLYSEAAGTDFSFHLRETAFSVFYCGWDSVALDLYSPEAITVTEATAGSPAFRRSNLCFHMPEVFGWSEHCLAGAEVENDAELYLSEQRRLHRQMFGTAVAARPASSEQPDSDAVRLATYRPLRDTAMQSLVDALVGMLRQAARYRGRHEHPAPVAAAAVAGQVGAGQAGGA